METTEATAGAETTQRAADDNLEVAKDLFRKMLANGAEPRRLIHQVTQAATAKDVQRDGVPERADVRFEPDEVSDLLDVLVEAIKEWTYPQGYMHAVREVQRLRSLAKALTVVTRAELAANKPLTAAHQADREYAQGMRTALRRARNRIDEERQAAARAQAPATPSEKPATPSEEPETSAQESAPLPGLHDFTTEVLSNAIHYAGQSWMKADAEGKVCVLGSTNDVRLEQIWAVEVERELVRVFRRLYDAYPTPHGLEAEVSYPTVEMASAAYAAWRAKHVHTAGAHGPALGDAS